MKYPFASLLLFAACALLSVGAHAEKADTSKPMNIEADALRYDDLHQTSVFTGNVVVTKGTIIIRGARVDVRQDPEGYQYATVTAAPGKLAFYRQKREGLNEYIEGESQTIEYDGKADTVKFIGRAVLRRYTGATLSDETTGALITYNNATDVFTVDGRIAQPGGDEGAPGTRVRAMLIPQAAASASAGTPPAAAPAALQPSSRLGGTAK
ncbi:MAG: lipopolysaccharide transport periplasmic protein LptA [Burkholderiales bacterium]|nr:lipopolysaccharide transport periplasmic protein LptA [Burkholderiales bacterium]